MSWQSKSMIFSHVDRAGLRPVSDINCNGREEGCSTICTSGNRRDQFAIRRGGAMPQQRYYGG